VLCYNISNSHAKGSFMISPAPPPPFSYLAWSAFARLGAAAVALTILWLAVAWAIGWIG
jgi:hypothetical protein